MKRSCEYGATCAVRAPLFPANCDIGPNDRTGAVSTISLHHRSRFFEFFSGRARFELEFYQV